MKKVVMFLMVVFVMVMFSGCSTVTVSEFDKDSGKLVKVTETKNTTIATITASTQNKTILIWNSGWVIWLEGSPATTEEPTPHVKIKAGNIDSGILLLHKDQKEMTGLADIIRATRSNLSANSSGFSSSTPASK